LADRGFTIASGEKGKARDILAAIRTLKQIEQEQRPATAAERETLVRFAGFGAVALSIFPDPVNGRYKDASWQAVGEELKELLSPEEYDSAKRTTFNAFYTSPIVIAAIHEAIARLGVGGDSVVASERSGRDRSFAVRAVEPRVPGPIRGWATPYVAAPHSGVAPCDGTRFGLRVRGWKRGR
jgi:hypothetical protein